MLHRGKRPARKRAGREEWEAELKHLIAVEDFEGAARLRDQMAQKKPISSRRTKTG
jgi:protein-arginine kinase activator protein McsA